MRRFFPWCLALALAGCGRDRPAVYWADRLQDADPAVRVEAVKRLANKRGDAAVAVPALTEALRDSNPFVRRDAAVALGHFGTDAKSAVPSLRTALKDREGSVRRAAAVALKQLEPGVGGKAAR